MKSPKSVGISQSQSPLATTKSTAQPNSSGKRDYAISSELEYYFANAEYTRAAHLFSQLDYKKPANISLEKFNNWLTITNRLKDSQLNDIVNKLKILIAFTAGQDVSADPSFFERDDLSSFEKIVALLDERIPKALVKSEYSLPTSGPSSTARRVSNENNFTNEQLLMKIDYLNSQLKDLQQQMSNKDGEVRVLKERLREKDGFLSQQKDYSEKDYESLLKNIEKEVKTRVETEQKLQDANYELVNLQDRIESLEHELQIKQRQLTEAQSTKGQHSDALNKLVKQIHLDSLKYQLCC